MINSGDTAFVLLSTALVMLMTPGLAFFYGGLATKRNTLAIMIQSFVSMGWTSVIWYVCGYSLCFSGHGPIIGNFNLAFLSGVKPTDIMPGNNIPLFVFILFLYRRLKFLQYLYTSLIYNNLATFRIT